MASKALKKNVRARGATYILISLLFSFFACGGETVRTTQQPQGQITVPRLDSFQFQTVTTDASGRVTDRRSLRASSYAEELGDGVRLEMVEIPAGTFEMGLPPGEKGRWGAESPKHSVTVQRFYAGRYEVTQAQWRVVAVWPKVDRELNPGPSKFKGNDLPVEQVSWYDAVEFCKRLSVKTGREYRLPSEAEWEYAARAGTQGPFAFGETITTEVVNYNGDYPFAGAVPGMNRGKTVAVGSLGVANAFGLYDTHGNVEEWCLDNWHDDYAGAPVDGSAWRGGGDPEYQVLRGGSWYSSAAYCRSALRNWLGPQYSFSGVGFRVVATPRP